MKEELTKPRRPRFNTTKQERKALKTLKRNTNIVIKPADTGRCNSHPGCGKLHQRRRKTAGKYQPTTRNWTTLQKQLRDL